MLSPSRLPPQERRAGAKLPTLYSATRYWRGRKDPPISPYEKPWIARGYAVVDADVRGTGDGSLLATTPR